MRFEYETKEDDRECVAALYEFNGGPELCLAIKAQLGKTVWLYHLYHNEILASVQGEGLPDGAVKEFKTGDKITIEF